MQKVFFALLLLAVSAGSAGAHGGISKLPDSVQIMQYKMLLYMDENDAETRNNLAMAYFRTNELTEAAQQLEAVLRNDANNFDALDGMGIVLLKQKKPTEALKYLDRALAINARDVMLHVHRSLAHQQLNHPDLARKAMETAKGLTSTLEEIAAIQEEIRLISQS
jgi:tetratricopeptide (TPR) repeat protein